MLVLTALTILVITALLSRKIRKHYSNRDRKGRFIEIYRPSKGFYSVTDMRREVGLK